MIDLEQQFRALKPRRSLMMSYAVSLLHFEFFLLEHLLQSGEGRVTLLVDPRAYQLSFAEGLAVHGVGLDYRIAAVHLPNARASFHPKLYFFSHQGGLTLFVASANLTLGGCRRNVEVVDRMDVHPDGTGDLGAFREYSAFLRDLLELDPALPRAVRAEVEETVREIDALPFDPAVRREGPRFLHTLHFDLLTQIAEHIPRNEVEEITVCSSSFDAQGTALAALADAYPDTRLRIFGRAGDRSSLNGSSLAGLAGRMTLHDFRLTAEADEKRPLHAKLAVFRGAGRCWLVSGSANLSAPAWNRAASETGNVEAVTLRSAADPQPFDDLFAVVEQTEPIPFDGMRWTPGDDARLDTPPPFRIAEARVQDEHVIVRLALLEPGWREADFELVAPSGTGEAAPLSRTGGDEPGVLGLSADLPAEVVSSETAVAVRVQARGTSGAVGASLAWLDRPDAQDRTSSERALRRSIRGLERRGMLTSTGDLQRISEFLFRLSSGLGRAAQAQESATTAESRGIAGPAGEGAAADAHAPGAAREIAGITLGEGGTHAVGSRHAEAASLLERIIQALRRARAGGDAGGQDEPGTVVRRTDDSDEELTAEDLASDEAYVDQVPDVRPGDIATMARRLTESAQEMFGDAPMAADVLPTTLRFEALLEFLLNLYLLAVLTASERERVIEGLAKLLEGAFSLDGFEVGNARGWLVRAWMDPACRPAVEREWSLPMRVAHAAAAIGTVVAEPPRPPRPSNRAQTDSVRTGFRMVAGLLGAPPSHEAMANVGEAARAVARIPGAPGVDAILSALRAAPAWSRRTGAFARDLAALVNAQEKADFIAEAPAYTTVAPDLRRLFERLSTRWPKAAVPLRTAGQDVRSGCCNLRVPPQQGADAWSRRVQCGQCGRLLIPFDFTNPEVRAILGILFTETVEGAE